MKKGIVLCASMLLACGLVSCGGSNSKTEVIYGVVNGDLVGKIELTHDGKKVSAAKIDEGFFLTETALVSKGEAPEGFTAEEYVAVEVTGWSGTTTNYYAKYMKVGETLFTAAARAEAVSGESLIWTATGVTDYFETVKTVEGGAAYWKAAVTDKSISMAHADGSAITHELGYVASYTTPNKADANSTYWKQSDTVALGWKGNIAEVEKALCIDFTTAPTLVKDETSKKWSVNGVESGATLTAFGSYFDLVSSFLAA